MTDCCTPKGYRWVFSERSARAEAKRYRRKGLDATSRRIFDFVKKQGVEGRTVLEVGGGIGVIQIELLKAGAARAVSVELTPTYEEEATALLREMGLEERVERRDRKSTRLNSSHRTISYAVFCLKKKKKHSKLCGAREATRW